MTDPVPLPPYSPTWFETFLETIDADRTRSEVGFVAAIAPPQAHRRLLDACCGPARHAAPLAGRGYLVTGFDLNPEALERARERAPDAAFLLHDLHAVGELEGPYDVAICMWQSFGWGDGSRDARTLAGFARVLRSGGRLLLDVYQRDFHERRDGEVATFEHAGRDVRSHTSCRSGILDVRLDYVDSSDRDHFRWRVYRPNELSMLASATGLETVLVCTNFDCTQPVTPAAPRMQMVFERR